MCIWRLKLLYTRMLTSTSNLHLYTFFVFDNDLQGKRLYKIECNQNKSHSGISECLIVLVRPQRPEQDMVWCNCPSPSIISVYVVCRKNCCVCFFVSIMFCMSVSHVCHVSHAMPCQQCFVCIYPRHCFGYCILLCIWGLSSTEYVHWTGICAWLDARSLIY